MNSRNHEENNQLRSGLRKQTRHIDYKIWLWSCERNVSKREIKEYAKKAFEEQGIQDFKASDGWYRRWLGRWKKQNKLNIPNSLTTDNITREVDTESSSETLNTSFSKTTSFRATDSNKSETINAPIKGRIASNMLLDGTLDDINESIDRNTSSSINNNTNARHSNTNTNSKNMNNFKNNTSRKKGERYLPHFKAEVVSYASQASIKEAANCYKVNKGTVSDWIRESNKFSNNHSNSILETEYKPDIEFIKWLRCEREENRILNRSTIKSKILELIKQSHKSEIKKSSLWFINYYKRFECNSLSATHIMYPSPFKHELALLCKSFSKKLISDMFNIDRKRIRNWFHLFNEGDLKKVNRNVNNYLTDKDIDKDIWEWYQMQPIKPSFKQIRERGRELYSKAGYIGVKCSRGWYYRWCKRHSLPLPIDARIEKDVQLLEWLLTELDRNNNVSYAMLKSKASQLLSLDLKPSTSWAIRFSKRYSSLLQTVPNIDAELPKTLQDKIITFKNDFNQLVKEKFINQSLNLIAIDEIPLNFSSTGIHLPKTCIRKSGFENCHASVVVACSVDGTLFPTTLILKSPLEEVHIEDNTVIVLEQVNAINDENTIYKWFSEIFRNIPKPSIIVCDDYQPHTYLKQFYKQELQDKHIEVLLIPGGCNSKLQPVLVCLAEQFKAEIEKQWVKWNNDNYMSWVNRTARSPTGADIYAWVKSAHANLTATQKEQIRESFIKTGYIHFSQQPEQ